MSEAKYKVGDKVIGVSGKRKAAYIIEVGEFYNGQLPNTIFQYKIREEGFDYKKYKEFHGFDYHFSKHDNIRLFTPLDELL